MVDDDPRRNEPGDTASQPAAMGPDPEPSPDPEPTAPQPGSAGPSGTSVMPPVPGTPPSGVWSARAQVPNRGMADDEYEQADTYWGDEDGPPRGVLGPVLIGTIAVVLLAVLVVGVWLLLRGRPDGNPTPATPSTAPTTTRPPKTTAKPPKTTAKPPTSAAPGPIAVPDLHGLDYAAAASQLTKLGLVPARSDEPSSTVAAGKVVDTEPPVGITVPPGTTVTVNVSAGTPTIPPTSPSVAPSKGHGRLGQALVTNDGV